MPLLQIDKNQLRDCLLRAIEHLVREDISDLFQLATKDDEHSEETSRKLHEVCINHKLAEHLAKTVVPLLSKFTQEKISVDIEFNREGANPKEVLISGKRKTVRPDIIIHNRKSGDNKLNFLIVECKKHDTEKAKINSDYEKIKGLMTDSKFDYEFGLQILYGHANAAAKFLYKENQQLKVEELNF